MQTTIDRQGGDAQPPGAAVTSPLGRLFGILLWVLAFVLMFSAASYQRRTGPTYELSGEFEVGGQVLSYELLRSQETVRQARVAIPDPGDGATANLEYRRYPTAEPFTVVPMVAEPGEMGMALAAYLPIQPSAGKIEYLVKVLTASGEIRIPAMGTGADGTRGGEDTIILRYKDPVPLPVLVSHVLLMFFSILIGIRVALGALVRPGGIGRLAWIAMSGMTVGGLILGPVVQKYAFGAYWTGFPFGYDLTDNKTLVMWIAWALACLVLWRRKSERDPIVRGTLLAATVVMVAVYLIPHSFRGSELDYDALDSGIPAEEAIGVSEKN